MPTPIKAGFSYNHIILYDLLGSDEKMQTGLRLQDDLLHYADGEVNAGLTRFPIKSINEWTDHITRLLKEVSTTNLHPIIHIESHGDQDQGLLIGESNEYISWYRLNQEMTRLNTLLKNNLVVVISACFGSYLLTQINPTEPCPYFLLVGPDKEIQKETLQGELPRFYKTLLIENDIQSAMTHLSPGFVNTFTVEFFIETMRRYFLEDCVGKAKQERVERLTTLGRTSGYIINRKHMRAFRKLAKNYYGINEEVLTKYSKIFFHGTVEIPTTEFLASIRRAAANK